jgi:hypothetical protein
VPSQIDVTNGIDGDGLMVSPMKMGDLASSAGSQISAESREGPPTGTRGKQLRAGRRNWSLFHRKWRRRHLRFSARSRDVGLGRLRMTRRVSRKQDFERLRPSRSGAGQASYPGWSRRPLLSEPSIKGSNGFHREVRTRFCVGAQAGRSSSFVIDLIVIRRVVSVRAERLLCCESSKCAQCGEPDYHWIRTQFWIIGDTIQEPPVCYDGDRRGSQNPS